MKRVLIVLGAVVALVLVLLLALPLLFQDGIAARAKDAANRNLTARVDWRDASLGFFRNFPNLTLGLDDLTVVNRAPFEGDTLAAVRRLGVVLDLGSVLGYALRGQPVVVRGVELSQPRLNLIALEDGTANWNITDTTKPPEPESSRQMAVSLRNFEIEDGAVSFDNRRAKLQATLKGLNQSLSGDFSQKQLTVRTRADADTVSVSFGGMPYLRRVNLGVTADIAADLTRKVYTIDTTELRLNDLRLAVTGSARSVGEDLGLDLAFKAPSTNFRSILSLVPPVYAREFDRVRTAGSFTLAGKVKGEYNDDAFPAFVIAARVDSGAFKYPDLPLPVRDIEMDLALNNPGGSADSTVLDVDRFHLRIGRNPVAGRLAVRTPVSDPNVDLRVKGKLDLAEVRRAIKLENVDQLTGTISADAEVRARMSALDRKQYDRVDASGTVDVAGLTLEPRQSKDEAQTLRLPLAIEQASLRLAPDRARLTRFTGTVGSSDLQATGSIDNLVSWAFRDDTLKGSATVRSNRFDLDEWRSGEGDLDIIPVPPGLDFTLDATVDQLTYDQLTMRGARGRLRIKDQRATLDDFRMNTLGGQIALDGYYDTRDTTKPAFDVGFRMTRLDIPSAFKAFTTVQMLAPVARYARGTVSTDLRLNGTLGENMLPLFQTLTGKGALQTQNVALEDFPGMEKLVELTKLQILDDPTMQAIRTQFQIRNGRLVVQPFPVRIGPLTMQVSGSNGIDQSLDYNLQLQVPRSLLGGGANEAIAGLISKAGRAGINVNTAQEIPLDVQLGGTVTSPVVQADLGTLTSSVAQSATQAVTEAAEAKVDSAALRVVQEAERRAAAIRQEAESLAARVKLEGYQQADALMAEAGNNPLAQAGAKLAADRLRQESDDKAKAITGEAGRRADSLVSAARSQTGVR